MQTIGAVLLQEAEERQLLELIVGCFVLFFFWSVVELKVCGSSFSETFETVWHLGEKVK